MRLVNYGAGELSDRLTILSLKLLFGAEAGKDLTAFTAERTVLLSQIRSRTLNGVWFASLLELAAVNAALWHAEDDLRAIRLASPELSLAATVALAFRIQMLNDQRATLIEKINKDAGEGGSSDKVFRETKEEA